MARKQQTTVAMFPINQTETVSRTVISPKRGIQLFFMNCLMHIDEAIRNELKSMDEMWLAMDASGCWYVYNTPIFINTKVSWWFDNTDGDYTYLCKTQEFAETEFWKTTSCKVK